MGQSSYFFNRHNALGGRVGDLHPHHQRADPLRPAAREGCQEERLGVWPDGCQVQNGTHKVYFPIEL